MPEATPNGTATVTAAGSNPTAPVQPAPGGSAAPSIPAGHRLVSDSDWQAAERHRQQAEGSAKFWEKAKGFGITKPEDFDRYGPALKAMAERRIDPEMFSRAFSPEADDDLGGEAKPLTMKDLEAREKALEQKWQRNLAEREAQGHYEREAEFRTKALAELRGESEWDDHQTALHTAWLERELDNAREKYPDGHPLAVTHGYQPINDTHTKKVLAAHKALMEKSAGAALKAKADAATKGVTRKAPPAGNSAGQGPPKNEPDNRSFDARVDDFASRAVSGAAG